VSVIFRKGCLPDAPKQKCGSKNADLEKAAKEHGTVAENWLATSGPKPNLKCRTPSPGKRSVDGMDYRKWESEASRPVVRLCFKLIGL
jgi:hypothetical protein